MGQEIDKDSVKKEVRPTMSRMKVLIIHPGHG